MYKHGIEVVEKKTTYQRPLATSFGVQVVVGTAPIHLTKDSRAPVNRPILVQSFSEAQEKLGYTDDWRFSLCQSMYSSFKLFNVYPVVFINVLDPDKHSKECSDAVYPIKNHQAEISEAGVILDSIRVSKGTASVSSKTGTAAKEGGAENSSVLLLNEDYIVSFNGDGIPVITFLSTGAGYNLDEVKVKFNYLDPEMVTEDDIIGYYDMETGLESGVELIRRVYPQFHLPPGLLLAPGWSQKPNVGAALQEKCTEINGVFRCECLLDLDTATNRKYSECGAAKNRNDYTDPHAIVLWPELLVSEKHIAFSAVYGAMASYYTATNRDIPYIYPSNKLLGVDGAVLADGTEITLDQTQAAYVNGDGVVTAVNDGGWRSWGNNTGCYPENTDPKDYRIACRRMFSFVANYFILQYQKRLDASMSRRTIDDIVNSFNIWGNSLVSQGMCAGLKMNYDESENDNESLLNGHVKVKISLAPYTPLEYIQASEEFDMNTLQATIIGGEE